MRIATSQRRLATAVVAAVAGVGATIFATSTASANQEPSAVDGIIAVSETPMDEPALGAIPDKDSPRSFRFRAFVPEGGGLVALRPSLNSDEFASEVLVLDSTGAVVGAYDAPYARNAEGKLLPATYRIVGNDLVQTVSVSTSTPFPVTVDLVAFVPIASGKPSTIDRYLVGIPSNYVYDPSRGSLHDYCTSSPDSFINPTVIGARTADFRGPCAVHDLCYEAPGKRKSQCDSQFFNNLKENCDDTYSGVLRTPVRVLCNAAAAEYGAAVVAFGDDPALLVPSDDRGGRVGVPAV